VHHPDYLSTEASSLEVEGIASDPPDFVFEMIPGGRIDGRVWAVDGEPCPGALVFAFLDGMERDTARSDDEGRFELRGLPEGRYDLFARSEEYSGLSRRKEIVVVRGAVMPGVDLQLEPAAQLEGTVRIDGRPAAGVRVEVRGLEGDVRRGARTEADGSFVVGDLYPGTYEVRIASRGAARSAEPFEQEFRVQHPGERLRLDVDLSVGASIEGGVIAPSGYRMGGVGVFLVDGEGEGQGESGMRQTETDEAGAYRFEGVPAGTYEIYARQYRGENELLGHRQIEIVAQSVLTGIDLPLSQAAWVSGRVVGADGRGRSGMTVAVSSKKDGKVQRWGRTDREGFFRVESLYDGRYELMVRGFGVRRSIEIEAGRPVEGLRVEVGRRSSER
jgi:hypothetical protein